MQNNNCSALKRGNQPIDKQPSKQTYTQSAKKIEHQIDSRLSSHPVDPPPIKHHTKKCVWAACSCTPPTPPSPLPLLIAAAWEAGSRVPTPTAPSFPIVFTTAPPSLPPTPPLETTPPNHQTDGGLSGPPSMLELGLAPSAPPLPFFSPKKPCW